MMKEKDEPNETPETNLTKKSHATADLDVDAGEADTSDVYFEEPRVVAEEDDEEEEEA